MRALVTGAGGLVGSEAVKRLCEEGYEVFGLENNMRRYFFGPEGSTQGQIEALRALYPSGFRAIDVDIRNTSRVESIFRLYNFDLVIHTAAQPSHDWAAKEPHTDFGVNALGTLNLIEALRQTKPDIPFCHISTSKVYGDNPNLLPLRPIGDRLDLEEGHRYHNGIDVSMPVDNCLHSLFGVSKLSGDLIVQEYGRYFDMPTVCFRPGCVTGAAHQGVELHGFLSYLMKCAITERPYTVYGYDGRQVRCNIHATDLVDACLAFARLPIPGAIFNIGGGRGSACSMREAMQLCEQIAGKEMNFEYNPNARVGDHRWWISDIAEFQSLYEWTPHRSDDLRATLQEIHDVNEERWSQ